MLLWFSLALAGPVDDAIALYGSGERTCIERDGAEDACWGGELDRATPVSQLEKPPQRQEQHCELREGQVFCTGTELAIRAGLPTGTDTDGWFPMPGLVGATELGDPGCALIDQQLTCLVRGGLRVETPRWTRLVSSHCGLTAEGAVTCSRRTEVPDATGITAVRMHRGDAVWRDREGQVWWSEDGKPAVRIDLPPLRGGDSSLHLGEAHRCALVPDGGVACWGTDHHNQLGDGGGPTMGWVAPCDDSYRPREQLCTAPCTAEEVWGSPTLADVPALTDVKTGPHAACGRDAEGWLRCYSTLGDVLVLPEPITDTAVDYGLYYGVAILLEDGTVLRFVDPGVLSTVFQLDGATGVMQTARTACAWNAETVRCHNHEYVFDLPSPGVPLEERGGAVCQQGRPLCLEGAIMLEDGPDTTPHRVEATTRSLIPASSAATRI